MDRYLVEYLEEQRAFPQDTFAAQHQFLAQCAKVALVPSSTLSMPLYHQ
jgi:hypothetical protein